MRWRIWVWRARAVEAGFSPARKHAALKDAATGAQPDGARRARQEALLKRAGETPALRKARGAYQDFLTLWKDADPDIPVFKQAKKEYARLQSAASDNLLEAVSAQLSAISEHQENGKPSGSLADS